MLRAILAGAVFGLDLYALAVLWGSRPPPPRRIAWTAAVVFIPVLGALWLLRARRRLVSGRW